MSKPVYISDSVFKKLEYEKVKDGRTLKAIVDSALLMYIDFKESERILNKGQK
ncbi:MAG: hypothetical protein PHW89_07840 [Sulfurimonas denitrificans]|nr:hypothetical protein [Sulfurimonas denitrificans]